MKHPEGAELVFHLSEGNLILTVPRSRVALCHECEDYHILIVEKVSIGKVEPIAAGLLHLVDEHGGQLPA